MRDRFVRSVTLLIISTILVNSPAGAAVKPDPAAMKAKIVARGEGQDVRVTLADKTQVKGFIVSIHEQNFVLKAKGPGEPRTIEYAQIRGVHRGHMSTGAKIAIGVGLGFVGILAVGMIAIATSGGVASM
jgi:hypothetical protein